MSGPIIKICGISTFEALDAAMDERADLVGLVHFEKSPRHVSLDQGEALADHARTRKSDRPSVVVLLVNPTDNEIDSVLKKIRPDLIQLHGHENPMRVLEIRQRSERPIIKAFPVESVQDFEQVQPYSELIRNKIISWLLFDAKPQLGDSRPGGLGRRYDWTLLRGRFPGMSTMLSGGLNSENVAEALDVTRVPAIDVSSGVEIAPGQKDPEKIKSFIRKARDAFVRLPRPNPTA